jgi:hypothetical protein
VSKVGEEQLFYLMSHGLSKAEASAMIRTDRQGAAARVRGRAEPADPAGQLDSAAAGERLRPGFLHDPANVAAGATPPTSVMR